VTPASEVNAGLRSVASSTSAVDRVTAEIRRAVLSGALPPGESFSISDISAKLGVSHIPVREAIRQLSSQGLIVMRAGRSAMVRPLSRDDLRSIFRLRELIESDLAARSCAFQNQEELAKAESSLQDYVGGDGDPDQLWDAHHEFHLALMRPAASEWDLRILFQLWHASDRYTRLAFDTFALSESERESRHVAHLALLAAARSGSPAEIRRAVSEHLHENEKACLERIATLSLSPDDEAASA
jgi:DNA-binding GntR family transcriptional regulator